MCSRPGKVRSLDILLACTVVLAGSLCSAVRECRLPESCLLRSSAVLQILIGHGMLVVVLNVVYRNSCLTRTSRPIAKSAG